MDGTLTDGGMYITESGDHFKRFHTRDGIAVKILKQHGIEVGLLSHSGVAKMVHERARMLNINYCYVGKADKLEVLQNWLKILNITTEQIAYLGDDVNDRKIMQAVGLSACPADASLVIRKIATVVLKAKGGNACLREFVDDVLKLEYLD